MINDESDYKSFYRTLLATLLSISMGFFIIHISEGGVRDIENNSSYALWIIEKMPFLFGHLLLLLIFGLALFFPLTWWLINRGKVKDSIIDALFVVTVGAFPFFMQNIVATIIQILDKTHEGKYINNFLYAFLYFIALIIYWRVGRSTCLMKGITETQNCIIEWFEKRG